MRISDWSSDVCSSDLRMVGIALQIADLAVLEVDVDAAAAGAHVAGGLLDLVGNFRAGVAVLASSLQWAPGHRSSLSDAPAGRPLRLLPARRRYPQAHPPAPRSDDGPPSPAW